MARFELIVPCYNEADRLPTAAFLEWARRQDAASIVFVNDGSTDDTAGVLAQLVAAGDGRLAAITLPRNVGKAAAVRHGLLAALERNPEFIGYWDADLATPLAAVQDFLNVFDASPQVDIVMGARIKLLGRNVHRRNLRHYPGRMFATAAAVALRVPVYDTQCGAKMFRATPAMQAVLSTPFQSRWVFDIELLSRYIAVTGRDAAMSRIYELPLTTWIDKPGSKVKLWHAFRAIWDICRIWRQNRRVPPPTHAAEPAAPPRRISL